MWSPDYVHEEVADAAAWTRAIAYSLTVDLPDMDDLVAEVFPDEQGGVVVPLRAAKGA